MSKQSHAATDGLSKQAHASVNQIAKSAAKAEELVRQQAATAQAGVRKAGRRAKDGSEETLESVNGYVRGNPVISLLMALGAGALLYALKRRL